MSVHKSIPPFSTRRNLRSKSSNQITEEKDRKNHFVFKNEITYQVSKELYEKYRFPYSYINFITKSKNEIYSVLDSYM